MDLKDIKALVEMVNSSELAYFELKMDNNYIKMDKSLTRSLVDNKSADNTIRETKINENIVTDEIVNKNVVVDNKEESGVKIDENIVTINCPMVGTFYGSQSPDKDSFVTIGKVVSKGEVLCIVEAMKLMNEIECEFNGEIVDILIKEGQMVEYGQPMFKIRRA